MKHDELIKYLKLLQDRDYKIFSEKLIKTNYEIIGVRTPLLRKLSKDLKKTNYIKLLDEIQFKYHEEILLYGMLLNEIMDEKLFFKYFEKSLPFIDNWATSDLSLSKFKYISKNKEKYFKYFIDLALNDKEYYSRVGYDMLLSTYVEEVYINEILDLIENNIREEYYVNMAKAWLLCELFIKYRNITLKYLKTSKLDRFTYNKAISKMCDSYRVTKEDKDILRKMRK